MAKPLIVALPPNLDLWDGCTIQVDAVSPTTGARIGAVNVSDVTLEVDQTAGGSLEFGPFMLVTGPGG